MSTNQNPFTAVLEAQRTAVEQSQSMTHEMLEAQKASFGAVADVVSTSESMVEQNAELTKGAIHASFDALEANMPEEAADFDELRQMVDEQFDTVTEAQIQSLEALVDALEESGTAYDEFADSYVELVDSSFDSFLEAHEQVEANVAQLSENVEDAASGFDVSA